MMNVEIRQLSDREFEIKYGSLRAFACTLVEALDQADSMRDVAGTAAGMSPKVVLHPTVALKFDSDLAFDITRKKGSRFERAILVLKEIARLAPDDQDAALLQEAVQAILRVESQVWREP